MTSVLAIALTIAAAPAPDRATDIAALRDAKLRAWPGFYRANDADGLSRFLADSFVALSEDGSRETKKQAVEWVRTNKWTNAQANFRYEIADIAFYGADTANVYGAGSFDGRSEAGEACRMRYTSSNIFVRQQSAWRPIFSHTSAPACAKEGE